MLWYKLKQFPSKNLLAILLILVSINGIVFIFVVPPWMHYDEPGHFEYAWLAANLDHWPAEGEYDQEMRRQVGASMLEHDFHEYSIFHLLKTTKPISIITEQTGDVPLYYFLVSLPLRLVKFTDITFQLYVARFISLFLYLFTVFLCHKTCVLIFTKKHALTWMIPLLLVFLPGFIDIMTAVNNDVAATAAFSFFILASVILIKKGFSFKNIVLRGVSVALCIFSKSSAWLAVPLSVVIIIVAALKKFTIKLAVVIVIACLVLGSAFFFSWDESAPALFYATGENFMPRTVSSDIAPLGSKTIMQEGQNYQWQGFYQTLSTQDVASISGQDATLGAWIWADEQTTIRFPRIGCEDDSKEYAFTENEVTISKDPTFISFSTQLPEIDNSICWIRFYPDTEKGNNVYWDGIVLVQGLFSEDSPQFTDGTGSAGTWEGKAFVNLVRNASGERSWPVFSKLSLRIIPTQLRFSASRLFTILDFQTHSWYFHSASSNIFRTFWGVFGWGQIYYLGRKPYWAFIALTLLGIIGLAVSFLRRFGSNKLPVKFLFPFLFSVLLQFILVLFRGIGSWYANTFMPASRYIFPVIIPIAVLLAAGIKETLDIFHRKIKIPSFILHIFYICALMMVFIWAVATIYVPFA